MGKLKIDKIAKKHCKVHKQKLFREILSETHEKFVHFLKKTRQKLFTQ